MNILRLIKLPDLITVLNALFGFSAILVALSNQVDNALIFILLAAIADGTDGLVARNVEYSSFGINLDSFADFISFGVAPSIAAYMRFSSLHYVICAFSAAYIICGMLRLARFNVESSGTYFKGIPITTSGMFIALYMLCFPFPWALVTLLGILSFLMVSDVKYIKLRDGKVLLPLGIAMICLITLFYVNMNYITLATALLVLLIIYTLSPLFLPERFFHEQLSV